MRIKIIKKNIKHPNDKIIDATGDRFVDVSVSSGDRLVIEAQGQTTVITANANQLAQGAIENSQGLQFKRLNFDLLVGNGETTYVRISRFYLMSDVQLESVSWNGQLLNDTFVGQLNTWQYGSMVAESPISVSDPGAFVGVSNVSDTVAMGSATTTQVANGVLRNNVCAGMCWTLLHRPPCKPAFPPPTTSTVAATKVWATLK